MSTNASSTNIQTSATIQNVSTNQPMAYIDQMIAIQSLNALQNVFDKKNGWSKHNIIALLTVVGIDGIKKVATSAIDGLVKELMVKKGSFMLKPVKMVFGALNGARKAVFKRNHSSIPLQVSQKSTETYVNIEMVPSIAFWKAVVSSPDLQYRVDSTYKVTHKDINNTEVTETWREISLQSQHIKATCINDVQLTFNMTKYNKELTGVLGVPTETSKTFIVKDLQSLTSLIPYPEFNEDLTKFISSMSLDRFKETDWVWNGCCKSNLEGSAGSAGGASFPTQWVHKNLKTAGMTFKNKRAEQVCFHELYCLLAITQYGISQVPSTATLFGLKIYHSSMFHLESIFATSPLNTIGNFRQIALVQVWLQNQICPSSKKEATKSQSVTWILQSETLAGEQFLQVWNDYTESLKESVLKKQTNTSAHKTYVLKIKHNENVKMVDNPAYADYEENKQHVMSTASEKTQTAAALRLAMVAPPKQLKEVTYTKEIEQLEVTEINKDFSTLYLRKKDKERLINCLHQFKNKKDVLRALGIPNKMGVMLYGLPGCGKTSTISAIATYLEKDLFYVHLNNVKTNDELKMLFDHVNKKCVNGGVIVMEDIDAMTKVVHKRGDKQVSELSVAEVSTSTDSELTLEFFLNILQGSLTVEGTIFITTTNHLEVLDPAFYRDGRFDVKIEMLPCDHYQMNEICKKFFDRTIPDNLLARIPVDTYVPANFIYHFVRYIHMEDTDEEMLEPFMTKRCWD